jgi:hypothetical protein
MFAGKNIFQKRISLLFFPLKFALGKINDIYFPADFFLQGQNRSSGLAGAVIAD